MANQNNRATGVAGSTIAEQLRETQKVVESTDAADKIIAKMKEENSLLLAAMKKVGYGEVECSLAEGTVSERFGKKSCAVIEVTLPIPHLGLRIIGTIWGRLENKPEGTTVTFEAAMPKFIKATDAVAKERILAAMENGAAAWAGFDKATASAEARLMGQTTKVEPGETARPKLVKRVLLATTTPAA